MRIRLDSVLRILTYLLAGATFLLACAATTVHPAAGRTGPVQQVDARPSLVVVVVVDQLRGDLLDRYSSVFTGGLKRLLDRGLVYTNALHGHAATETAPGHAAISTGVNPIRSGLPSNTWREGTRPNLRRVENVIDPTEELVGIEGLPGASPKVLWRPGLADWVRDMNSNSRVISVSGKPRAAILMAGKATGDIFWFDGRVGRFVTSTYYRDENPGWLDDFNADVIQGYRADSVWMSTIPPGSVDLSSPDTAAFEGDGVHTFFPHRYSEERTRAGPEGFFLWFENVPMLDQATFRLARLAMEKRQAGRTEGRTDFLSISLSQTDRVGHDYGPLSREQMDNLLRLDRELGAFLEYLDGEIGPDRYVLGFTGDHGVLTNPERLGYGRRLTTDDRSLLSEAVIRAVEETARDGETDPGPRIKRALGAIPFVGPAFSHQELEEGGEAMDSLAVLYSRNRVAGRAGGLLSAYGVEMWWSQGVLDWGYTVGTTHGSPFHYDRWVPLILMGEGVEPGRVDDPVAPLDLAPTMAAWAGIPYPDDLDGRALVRK